MQNDSQISRLCNWVDGITFSEFGCTNRNRLGTKHNNSFWNMSHLATCIVSVKMPNRPTVSIHQELRRKD